MKLALPGFLRRGLNANIMVGVGLSMAGVSVARIVHSKDVPPVLDLCTFNKADGDEARLHALQTLADDHDLDIVHAAGILQPNDYNLLLVEAPEVPDDEMRAAVRWRVKDLIDFPIEEAVVDVFDVPVESNRGGTRMIYAVVARASAVRQTIATIESAGLHLDVIDIPEMAMRNIAALLPEDASGVALIRIGQDSGLVTLTRQGTLYMSRRMNIGTRRIDNGGLENASDELSPAVKQWADSIVIEVQRSLDYYESHFTHTQITNVVFAPLDTPIPGLVNYFSAQMGLAARMMDINALVDCPDRLDEQTQARCLSAIGAGLRFQGKAA